jgi:hypothetical protein
MGTEEVNGRQVKRRRTSRARPGLEDLSADKISSLKHPLRGLHFFNLSPHFHGVIAQLMDDLFILTISCVDIMPKPLG